MVKYRTPFYAINKLMGDMYALEAIFMTLIQQRGTIVHLTMPQVGTTAGTCAPDGFETLSPSFRIMTGLTLLVAESI